MACYLASLPRHDALKWRRCRQRERSRSNSVEMVRLFALIRINRRVGVWGSGSTHEPKKKLISSKEDSDGDLEMDSQSLLKEVAYERRTRSKIFDRLGYSRSC